MTISTFAVSYDYRCPFARNAHEHLFRALDAGAPWEVELVPFSLTQSHVAEGDTPVWDDPQKAGDRLSIEAGLAVRELTPERFDDVHLGFFAARHDEGKDLRTEQAVREVLQKCDVDPEPVFEAVAEGWPRETFRKAHEAAVKDFSVFGVPTFIAGNDAVFVRIMTRPDGDADVSRSVIEKVLALLTESPELNEYKHTTIAR